jgi:hypothetical protein
MAITKAKERIEAVELIQIKNVVLILNQGIIANNVKEELQLLNV